MMKKTLPFLLLLIGSFTAATAQKISPEEYVATYKDLAIREMKRMGVPAAITLAQGILETESGNSVLVKKSNNHFGVKCKSSWSGESVTHDDDALGECFRSYKDAEASYRDHSNYLRGADRYASLFALDLSDYKGWAYGLRRAGYATNQKYPEILIKNIELYNLQQYTLNAISEVPKIETGKYQDETVSTVSVATQKEDGLGSNAVLNTLKYIQAKKGTSLLAIATEQLLDLNKLLIFNDLQEDGILKNDQLIFLQRKSKFGPTDTYLVQPNETLYDIAQKNGIQLIYLLAYNQLGDRAVVTPGTTLYLNASAKGRQQKAAPVKAVDTATIIPAVMVTSAARKLYEVQAKEGLYGIAKKFQVTVQQLKEWNNLTTDELHIGQQLIIAQ